MRDKIDCCLQSIFESDANKDEYEVIVCDSSNDESQTLLNRYAKLHSNLKLITNKTKLSTGYARNLAVQHAVGEYIYMLDIDDKLYDNTVLSKILSQLDGTIDIYYCPYYEQKNNTVLMLKTTTIKDIVNAPIGILTKLYKRKFYVKQPGYRPEDVIPHFLVIDKCKTVSYFDFIVYNYDNRDENIGAISRTFDYLKHNPQNLIHLAMSNDLCNKSLYDEYVSGVIKNLADMYQLRNTIMHKDVKYAFMRRFIAMYKNFMSGFYIH